MSLVRKRPRRPCVALAFLAASLLSLFFGAHRERLLHLRRGRATQLLLKLRNAFLGRLQLLLCCLELLLRCLQLTLLRSDHVDETFDPDPSLMHLLSQHRDGVHAIYTTETAAYQLHQFSRIPTNSGDGHSRPGTNPSAPSGNATPLHELDSYYAGKVDLIYIDPPFATGADFSFTAQVGESGLELTKNSPQLRRRPTETPGA